MSSLLRSTRLIDLCTPSISYDAQVQAGCEAFDYQCFQIIDDTGQVVMIPNIMNLTDPNLVDILAWQFHVDFYDHTKDIEFRKQLVQLSIVWHMTKGTVDLVQQVLDMYYPNGAATLQEWFQYDSPLPPGQPDVNWHKRYLFKVFIDQNVISGAAEENAMLALINLYKPISRWLETIERPRTSECDIGWASMILRFIYRQSEAPTNYP